MNALVYSSSLVASFLGGVLALFAPCCVVSLLPTFTAAALQQRGLRLVATTTVFAAGVATVLLPIVLGIGALGQVLGRFHSQVFLVVGLFLLGLGIYVLSGRGFMLPMPTVRSRPTSPSRVGGVYVLGVVSGIASSCCAPVLIGVVAMSALASSTIGAVGLGLSYIFGMVFPLFVFVILWERLHLGERRLFAWGTKRIALGKVSLVWTDALAGVIFVIMGGLSSYLGITGQGTYTPGWFIAFNRWAVGQAGNLAMALRGVPIILQALVLLILAGSIIWAVHASWHGSDVRSPQGR
jgi:cytochrome c biogenesis protein CcdA